MLYININVNYIYIYIYKNASGKKVTPYFSKKAIMIGGRTKIGSGRATRVSAVSISAWKKKKKLLKIHTTVQHG